MKIFALALLLSSLAFAAPVKGRKPSSTIPPAPQLATGVIEIPNPEKQFTDIYAISDVHGMVAHQITLLTNAGIIDANQNWAAGKSLLVIVGDSINKGPESIEVVNVWLKLQPQALLAGGQIIHLLGNHEAEFLADPNHKKPAKQLNAELQSEGLDSSDFTDATTAHGIFMRKEALAARIGNWLFCHAGLYPTMPWDQFKIQAQQLLASAAYDDPMIAGDNSILEAKDWWKDQPVRTAFLAELAANGMIGVVQGHQPSAYNIVNSIGSIEGGKMIRIDTGMAPDAGSHPGMMLHFTNPAQLSAPIATQTIPSAVIIYADGTRAPLVPMVYDPTKFHPDTID